MNAVYDSKKMGHLRKAVQQLPCARPQPTDVRRFLSKYQDLIRSGEGLTFARAPVLTTLHRRKRSGKMRAVSVLDPYSYFVSNATFSAVADALPKFEFSFGHHPFGNRSTGEHNSKAEQLEDGFGDYGGSEYSLFLHRLKTVIRSAPPHYIVKRRDISNFYPSTIQAIFQPLLRRHGSSELELQALIAEQNGSPGMGISVDLVGAHAAVLSGYVLLPLDETCQQATSDSQVFLLRYIDDVFIIGKEEDVDELLSLVTVELDTLGLDLNRDKSLDQGLSDLYADFVFDTLDKLRVGDLSGAAISLSQVPPGPGCRKDAGDKWLIHAASKESALSTETRDYFNMLVGDCSFMESLSSKQWNSILTCLARNHFSAHHLIETVGNIPAESTYTLTSILSATQRRIGQHPGIAALFELAASKSRAGSWLDWVNYVPTAPVF